MDASSRSRSATTPSARRSLARTMLVWRSPAASTEANSEYSVPSGWVIGSPGQPRPAATLGYHETLGAQFAQGGPDGVTAHLVLRDQGQLAGERRRRTRPPPAAAKVGAQLRPQRQRAAAVQ